MESAVFFGTVAACYGTAWSWGVMLADAWRRRNAAGLFVLAAGVVTLLLVTRGPMAFPARPLVYLPLALAAAGAYYFGIARPNDDWKWLKVRHHDARQVALHLVLVTGALAFALPWLWMVLTSLKPDDAIFKDPMSLPDPWKWSNYPKTFAFLEVALGHIRTGFGSLFVLNTLQVATLSLAAMLLSSSMVAFAFARLRWPGRDILFLVLLGTMMLPTAVTMIPRFIIFQRLGWIDTLLPLWVPSLFASAVDVFLLRQFLLGIPTDLEDAAKIDGCGYWTIYWRVMLPLVKPAIAALAINHFLATWNDFLNPLIYIASPERMTGSYALRLFHSANSGEWALLLAAAALWTVPVIALFFVAQRAFIEGVTLTGMKN